MGGLDDRMWEIVRGLEVVFMFGKFVRGMFLKGCLRVLEVNLEKRVLRDVFVFRDISVGCISEGFRGIDFFVVGEDLFLLELFFFMIIFSFFLKI